MRTEDMKKKTIYVSPDVEVLNLESERLLSPASWGTEDESNNIVKDDGSEGMNPDAKDNIWDSDIDIWE